MWAALIVLLRINSVTTMRFSSFLPSPGCGWRCRCPGCPDSLAPSREPMPPTFAGNAASLPRAPHSVRWVRQNPVTAQNFSSRLSSGNSQQTGNPCDNQTQTHPVTTSQQLSQTLHCFSIRAQMATNSDMYPAEVPLWDNALPTPLPG